MLLDTPPALAEFRSLLLAGPCAGERVATAFPKDAPDRLVRIERIGGRPESTITDAPRMLVHVYDTDGIAAEQRATRILDYLEHGGWSHTRTESGHLLRGWRTETMMPLLDPDRPHLHRWQVMGAFRLSRLTSRRTS